jgi:ribonuclease Z
LAIAASTGHDIDTPGPSEKKLVYRFDNGLEVFAFGVDHSPVEPAFGYRVEYKGRAVVISGDTRASDNMTRQAKGADLLIHEAFNKNLINKMISAADPDMLKNESVRKLMNLAKQVQHYHTSPVEAATIASDAGVKKLVFTHIDPPLGPFVVRHLVTQPFFLKGVSEVYQGEVVIAEDGMHFELAVD